ncbi:60S ribosomal protein L19 [Dissophora globulifera]|nr:60S ribosomal protein L19 [Dissophora globulifera]
MWLDSNEVTETVSANYRRNNRKLVSDGVIIKNPQIMQTLFRHLPRVWKIYRHLYYVLYITPKGNVFKNKRVLVDFIHAVKADKVHSKLIADQTEAHRTKAKATRTRRNERIAEKRAVLSCVETADAAALKKFEQ